MTGTQLLQASVERQVLQSGTSHHLNLETPITDVALPSDALITVPDTHPSTFFPSPANGDYFLIYLIIGLLVIIVFSNN